jgi:hypothetical protein
MEEGRHRNDIPRDEEINKIVEYFTRHVAGSWAVLTCRNNHVQTFTGAVIPMEERTNHKLHVALEGMNTYIRKNIDNLRHTSWPYELEEEEEIILQEEQGLGVGAL